MENKELCERMHSGEMYNDLSIELVQRRERAVFILSRISGASSDSISVLETISLPTLIVLCWMEISLR